MIDLFKYTYLLDIKNIRKSIDNLWRQYQKILDDPRAAWTEINEARAILYFIGYLYPEKIALESLEGRIKFINPAISLDKFLTAIDKNDEKILKKYGKNKNFQKLKEFYLIVKDIKNRVKNGAYLDEGRFNEKYKKLKPKNYF
ncbi:hypothetical protein KKB43_05515 [Patescibacteria group bacterium]|nr:hypothetical protein [Patescibacteria group bacterium]MBU4141449.1 hypothetical protein [Patescibacteria group bacterium]MBU4338514.1 hypothetical protein [Patescibacteria group bacterium]MBU4580445.1 hypothetical protein [Patescibacteria group bacterium]